MNAVKLPFDLMHLPFYPPTTLIHEDFVADKMPLKSLNLQMTCKRDVKNDVCKELHRWEIEAS